MARKSARELIAELRLFHHTEAADVMEALLVETEAASGPQETHL